MLHKTKLIDCLKDFVPEVCRSTEKERIEAYNLFRRIVIEPAIQDQLRELAYAKGLTLWNDSLAVTTEILPYNKEHQVVAVDGSQIYPDRHQGISCFLLNIGSVNFHYGVTTSSVQLGSSPSVYTCNEGSQWNQEHVNSLRSYYEFEHSFKQTYEAAKHMPNISTLALCDGSLIFWHLENKPEKEKEEYLAKYMDQLELFHVNRLWLIGYISMPKSKDIVELLRLAISSKLLPVSESDTFNQVVDADLLYLLLPQGAASPIFQSRSPITYAYPAHLRPHFLYFNTGEEIVRIEFPAWIAQDSNALSTILSIVFDQCKKGRGYPIALAEAHEQAVVKGPDRDFFYELLHKMTREQNIHYTNSQKSLKKRIVAI